MKILPGSRGWWVFGTDSMAHLPPEAATADGFLNEPYLTELRNGGFFSNDPSTDQTYFATVLTSTACNLACPYCFQAQNNILGTPRLRDAGESILLDSAMVPQVIQFCQDQMTAHNKEALNILLFGREPLMNPRVCIELLHAASDILRNAGIVTNGYLLEPGLAARLESAGLSQAQVTLDGSEPFHNATRTTRSGLKTYRKILRNLASCAATTGIEWTIRINITVDNLNSIDQVCDDIIANLPGDRCTVAFAFVEDIGTNAKNIVDLRESSENRNQTLDHLAPNAIRLLKNGFELPAPSSVDTCVYCGVVGGSTGTVISTNGKLYSCWESAGKPGWDVGDIWHGYYKSEVLSPHWVACGYGLRDSFHRQVSILYDELLVRVMDRRISTEPDL